MFPGTEMAPPITTTSLARRKVSGSEEAAVARFVSGPMATIVIVSGAFPRRRRRISWCAGVWEGVNNEQVDSRSLSAAASVMRVLAGGGSKSFFQVSEGVRWGCCARMSKTVRWQRTSTTYA